jgi:Family of unknown function (DUF6527)
MAKLYKISGWRVGLADLYFYCPSCDCDHGVWTINDGLMHARWQFNGDMEKPTFTPSLKVTYTEADKVNICHMVITDGKIDYCGDCTNKLYAGKTVEMEDIQK